MSRKRNLIQAGKDRKKRMKGFFFDSDDVVAYLSMRGECLVCPKCYKEEGYRLDGGAYKEILAHELVVDFTRKATETSKDLLKAYYSIGGPRGKARYEHSIRHGGVSFQCALCGEEIKNN